MFMHQRLVILVACAVVTPLWGGDACVGLVPVTARGKFGYVDSTGSLRIEPKFTHAGLFSEGLSRVGMGEGSGERYGFVNSQGEIVVAPQFESATDFSDGLAAVFGKEGRVPVYGYIDKTGHFAIPLTKDPWNLLVDHEKLSFHEGLAVSPNSNATKYSYINRAGKPICGYEFDAAEPFSEGLGRVKLEDRFGYIDVQGRIAIEPKFIRAGDFSEGLAPVVMMEAGREVRGFIGRAGKLVLRSAFNRRDPPELWWEPIIDEPRMRGLELTGQWQSSFTGGLAPVRFRRRLYDSTSYCFINTSGEQAFSCRSLVEVDNFHEGLAAVCLAGQRHVYIDTSGRVVIEAPEAEAVWPFQGGFARVVFTRYPYTWGWINKTGKIIWESH
jgi:hypothetical protein